jgi:hypothetical protein
MEKDNSARHLRSISQINDSNVNEIYVKNYNTFLYDHSDEVIINGEVVTDKLKRQLLRLPDYDGNPNIKGKIIPNNKKDGFDLTELDFVEMEIEKFQAIEPKNFKAKKQYKIYIDYLTKRQGLLMIEDNLIIKEHLKPESPCKKNCTSNCIKTYSDLCRSCDIKVRIDEEVSLFTDKLSFIPDKKTFLKNQLAKSNEKIESLHNELTEPGHNGVFSYGNWNYLFISWHKIGQICHEELERNQSSQPIQSEVMPDVPEIELKTQKEQIRLLYDLGVIDFLQSKFPSLKNNNQATAHLLSQILKMKPDNKSIQPNLNALLTENFASDKYISESANTKAIITRLNANELK